MHRTIERAITLAALLLLACTPHAPPTAPDPAPSRPAAPPEPLLEPAPAPSPSVAAPFQLGWPRDLRDQPRSAREHNSRGLALHRAGDYTGSLAQFDAAMAISSDYPIARFNRACALSRLHRTAEAAEVMKRLLSLDLPEFAPRLDTDEDLANLRSSPDGPFVSAHRNDVVQQYAAAVARGAPVLLYTMRQPDRASGNQPELPVDHRAGVWLPDTASFIPVTPDIAGSFALVWSSDTATVTVLHGQLQYEYWRHSPRSFTVDVYSLTTPATRLRTTPSAHKSFTALFPKQRAADDIWEMHLNVLGVRPLSDRTQLDASHDRAEQPLRIEIGAGPATVVRAPHEPAWTHTLQSNEGMLVSGTPPGYTRKNSLLTVPGHPTAIDLGKLHRSTQIVATRDNTAAFVLTQSIGCEFNSHRLLRVDLRTHAVRELSTGRLAGTLTAGLDGALHFQLGPTIQRLAPDGTLTDAALPAWLRLAVPIEKADCLH